MTAETWLTLAGVAGVWLLACSAVSVGVFLGMAALQRRVLGQDAAALRKHEAAQAALAEIARRRAEEGAAA